MFRGSIIEQDAVASLRRLFIAAKAADTPVVVSPHCYYPHDHHWCFPAPGEALMYKLGMFNRPSPLSVEGFACSGSDWLPELKDLVEDGGTIVRSPHKIAGPPEGDAYAAALLNFRWFANALLTTDTPVTLLRQNPAAAA